MRMCKEISKDLYYNGYKIQIFPNKDQKEFLDRCIDICRFMYNWTIEQEQIHYEEYLKGNVKYSFKNFYELVPLYTQLKKELDFLNSVPVCSGRSGMLRAIKAYKRFLNKNNNRPRFKSKKKSETNSFETRAERMHFEDNMLKIEGLNTLIYTKYHSGYNAKFRQFKHSVISRDNMNRYFISFCILELKPLDYFEINNIKPLNRAIGIDLNVKKRFVLSTGEIYYGPDLSRELVNLKTKQSRVIKDINRRKKMERTNPLENCQSKRAKKRLRAMQKQYKRVANITENFIQQTTKDIINMRPKAVVMEDLQVENFTRNHNIARHVYHANFGRSIEVMKLKCNKYGIPFIQADKDYPSTQLCSSCGNRQEMKLWQKTYKCPQCGLVIDRDINAALNLEKLAYR